MTTRIQATRTEARAAEAIAAALKQIAIVSSNHGASSNEAERTAHNEAIGGLRFWLNVAARELGIEVAQ